MGTTERKERERKLRKKTIMEAAQKIFLEKGFEHTTMDDIADEVELSKGALYFYFKSKSELCLSILLESLKMIHSEFKNISRSDQNGMEKIMNIFSKYAHFHEVHPQFINAVINFRHHRQDCDNNNEILQLALAENDKINDEIAHCIDCGINDGSIKPDLNNKLFAASLWGQLNGIMPNIMLASQEHKELYNTEDNLFNYASTMILSSLAK